MSKRFGTAVIIIPLAGSALTFLGSIFTTLLNKDDSTDEKASHWGDGLEARLQLGVHNIIHRVYNNEIALVGLFVTISLLISSVSAISNVAGTITHAIVEAVHTIDPSEDDQPQPNANYVPKQMEINELPINPASPVDLVLPIITPHLVILNPGLEKALKEEERSLLFFLSDKYLIDDWSNQDLVVEKVKQKIDDARSEQKDNKFNNYAPVLTQGEVARASELEANLVNSEELDEIICIREATYEKYPMYRLAKLLAENYSTYGLAFNYLKSNVHTTEYYYGCAISWYNEALAYEKTGEPVDELLRMIAIRYHDLAAIFPQSSPYQQYASKISDAYYTIINSGEYTENAYP